MAARNKKGFEFKLGTFGLVLFTFGVSLLIFGAFVLGVQVGKHIDTYPRKIVHDIPEKLHDTLHEVIPSNREKKSSNEAGEKGFTFYERLTKKQPAVERQIPKAQTASRHNTETIYIVQVASFRKRSMTVPVMETLRKMGYIPALEEIKIASSGPWYRITIPGFQSRDAAVTAARAVEKEMRDIQCLIKAMSPS